MARKRREEEGQAQQQEIAAPATAGMRLPSFGAESSLGPPTRSYRSPMMAGIAGASSSSAVLPSQWEDESAAYDETADEGADVSTDEADEVTGDAGSNDGDDDDESGGATN